MRRQWRQAFEGDWSQPPMRNAGFQCCSCCLVHRLDFRIRNGRVQLRARLDLRSTAALRRWRRHRGEPVLDKEK